MIGIWSNKTKHATARDENEQDLNAIIDLA